MTFPLVGIFPSGVFTTKAQALEAIIYECSFFLIRAFVVFFAFDEAPLNQVLIQILDYISLHKSKAEFEYSLEIQAYSTYN